MANCLRHLAQRHGVAVEITELDIARNPNHDLTQPHIQQRWLMRLEAGEFFALIVTPPCSTFSRACWANDQGPYPVRSRAHPRGFLWNQKSRAHKAFLGTLLADFSFEALKRHWKHPGRPGVMEQPEDLGATSTNRVPGHTPASMWQYPQFDTLLRLPGVQTVGLSQLDFGSESTKPTRLLLRDMGNLHPAMYPGPPSFDSHWKYLGPIPKRTGAPLIGHGQHGFRTSSSAAWPAGLSKWVAQQILVSYVKYRAVGANKDEEDKAGEASKEEKEDGADKPGKRRREEAQGEAERKKAKFKEEGEVSDPMNPPYKGGTGPPLACNWKGMKTPFHDGGGLGSPGRWSRGSRRYPEGEQWVNLRKNILDLVVRKLGDLKAVEKEAFRMAKGGPHFNVVRDEEILEGVREEIRLALGLGKDCLERAEGQPFLLRLLAGTLEAAGDPDFDFLYQAESGLPVGVLDPLPRTPSMYEEQTKWPLDMEDGEEALLEGANYFSAEEHWEHLQRHLDAEVEEGLMEAMTEDEFIEEFGCHRAIASLAVLVEDEQGKKRVIHDGSNKVKVNHRIKCRDKIRMPGAREKRCLLEVYQEEAAVALSLVGDFEKAHRRFKYQRKEQGYLACRAREGSGKVYVNKVGTFGVTSTPYWWSKISGALIRVAHYLVGPDWPVDMLLYADDLEVIGPGQEGRIGAVLTFLVLAAYGSPFKWKKQRGGLCTEWIGMVTDYADYKMGLSDRRAEWMCQWMDGIGRKGRVSWREFAAGLGRIGFSALALPWERPFLGPLYSWSAATRNSRGELEIPWAVIFILRWIARRLREGQRLEKVSLPEKKAKRTLKIWTDAKATDESAWIGGWRDTGEGHGKAQWFSVEVTEEWMPWLKCKKGNPKRVIASLEMLATLVAMRLWCEGGEEDLQMMAHAFTDNLGNSFVMRKGMSTKFPLTLLLMEASSMMREKNFVATLDWISRNENQEADALTNQEFEGFDPSLRVEVDMRKGKWIVLDELTEESQKLYEEIRSRKEANKLEKEVMGKKTKKGKFFPRWSS